jgi:hypothetical protein
MLFKCRKVKVVQGKQKVTSSLLPDPYDIFLVVTDIAVFTTLDIGPKSEENPWMYVDSRYTLYDLVKITSRKNSASMITFYFRIPKFEEYKLQLEDNLLDNIDKKPSSDYMFAHKRKNYVEICLVIEFDNSDRAHECIKKVSHLYKVLKRTET